MQSKLATSDQVPLFLHLPKTGGTTLADCIYDQCKASEDSRLEDGYLVNGVYYYPGGFHREGDTAVPAKAIQALARLDIRAVVGHFSFGIHAYVRTPWTYVTLLRHPVDRVISLYHHIRKEEDSRFHEVVRGMTIEDFTMRLSCREVDNDQTRRISGDNPEFGACSSSTLAKAKDNLRRYFSVVGVTEHFDETLLLIKRALGWVEECYYLPNLVNKDRPASGSLPQRSIDAMLERNQLDAALYEFAKELLYERISDQGPDFGREVQQFKASNAEYIAKYGVTTW